LRGKKAKRLRRLLYGDYVSGPNGRRYQYNTATGQIVSDPLRQQYQRLKKAKL
jgi:hypothetical protein